MLSFLHIMEENVFLPLKDKNENIKCRNVCINCISLIFQRFNGTKTGKKRLNFTGSKRIIQNMHENRIITV